MGPTSGAANRGWHCNATAAAETNVSRRTRARLTCIHIVETTVSDVYGLPGWSACGLWASHTPGIGSWQKAPQEIPWHVSASRVTGSTAIRRIGIGPRPLTGRVGAVDVGKKSKEELVNNYLNEADRAEKSILGGSSRLEQGQ